MIIARWSIDARFGHKQAVIDSMMKWQKEIGSQIGWNEMRLMTGSIGTRESTVQSEVRLDSIADLSQAWDKLSTLDAHKQWSRELEPEIVSGTARWEVLRVLAEK